MPQFGGASEKCSVCSKTVYVAEKIVVEDKEEKKTFHKGCLKCSHCKGNLSLGNYASMNGIYYCKPHFKQLFATKGNYDEGFGKEKATTKWAPQAVTGPASFVPVDKDEKTSSPKPTSESNAVASKFGRSATDKCHACGKAVYATEKICIEEKDEKKNFHKNCLKCSHCSVVLSLGNYASLQGVVYCKPHFKQLFAAKGNYDEGFGKEKASSKWEPQASSAPASFVPVDKDEKSAAPKTESPANIANKFNRPSSTSDKCQACGKTVYLTEKIVVEDKEDKKTYHKTCLKCSHCSCVLSLGSYASMNGVMYCKPHFKQLFATKGNYDEGFGKEKHTRKWQDTAAETKDEEEVPHHVRHTDDEPVRPRSTSPTPAAAQEQPRSTSPTPAAQEEPRSTSPRPASPTPAAEPKEETHEVANPPDMDEEQLAPERTEAEKEEVREHIHTDERDTTAQEHHDDDEKKEPKSDEE